MLSIPIRGFFIILSFIPWLFPILFKTEFLNKIINIINFNVSLLMIQIILAIILILTSIAIIKFVIRYLRNSKDITTNLFSFKDIQPANHEVIGYFIGFFFAFVAFNKGDEIAIVICIAVIIFALMNQFYFNPLLCVLGYHFYNVKSENGTSYLIITKKDLVKPAQMRFIKLNRFVFIDL